MADDAPETKTIKPEDAPAETIKPEDLPLNAKQKAFVSEYIIDMNGAQAAIRAGYSFNSAAVIATELLKKPNVAAAVARSKAQRAARVGMTQDSVLHEMSLLSHARIDHYVVSDKGEVTLAPGAPEDAMAAVQAIKKRTTVKEDAEGNITITYDVELRLWDKPTPLKLMGRHVGLFPDRMEHTGKDGGPIETKVTRVESVIIDPKKETT